MVVSSLTKLYLEKTEKVRKEVLLLRFGVFFPSSALKFWNSNAQEPKWGNEQGSCISVHCRAPVAVYNEKEQANHND